MANATQWPLSANFQFVITTPLAISTLIIGCFITHLIDIIFIEIYSPIYWAFFCVCCEMFWIAVLLSKMRMIWCVEIFFPLLWVNYIFICSHSRINQLIDCQFDIIPGIFFSEYIWTCVLHTLGRIRPSFGWIQIIDDPWNPV